MPKFRKKPVVIDAIQWTGKNADEVDEFFEQEHHFGLKDDKWSITTLEGIMTANKGDWIIRGIKGENYPCKDDIFRETYELVDD